MGGKSRPSSPELDFDSLPPALRRKYFSSLERLRLVQDGLPSSSVCNNPGYKTRPAPRCNAKLRPRSQGQTTSLARRPSTASSKRNRLHRTRSNSSHPLPSADIASWFASLPPAVQRKQFSPEEQILYTSRRDSFLLDSTDEAFYKQGRRASQPDRYSSSSPRTPYDFEDLRDTREMDTHAFDDFRWLDEEEELDLRLDDYHTAVKETASQNAAPQRERPSFRRHMSLSSMPFRRSSVSSLHTSNPPTPSTSQSRPLSNIFNPRHQRSQQSVSSIDPRARHYQDPEARLKLRVYLASPHKFDEAIEFGFPSAQDRLHYSRPKTSPRLTHDSAQTFFTEDTPSLSADEEDDKEDEPDHTQEDFLDPRTPEDDVFQSHRLSQRSSGTGDNLTTRFRVVRGSLAPYIHPSASAADREMTLHMTLTRPDLREADEQPAVKNINDEPLEQPPLSFEEPSQSIWDTLPVENSRMKKMWNKLIHRHE